MWTDKMYEISLESCYILRDEYMKEDGRMTLGPDKDLKDTKMVKYILVASDTVKHME